MNSSSVNLNPSSSLNPSTSLNSPTSFNSSGSYSQSSTNSNYSFLNISLTTWLLIIVILAFLGFNVFIYLAKGTQTFSNIFGPLFLYITGLFGNTASTVTKQITTTAATGTKAGVDIVAGTINSGVDVLGATASSSLVGSQKTSTNVQARNEQKNELNMALNSASTNIHKEPQTFNADDANSTIQSSKSSSKTGWCYIGEDREFRSCIQVGDNDNCISGDIFPSQDICVNPSLRQ